MKSLLFALPCPVVATIVPLEVALGLFLAGLVVIVTYSAFAEKIRRDRQRRDIERFFQRHAQRHYRFRG
jgi:hypothetical protein